MATDHQFHPKTIFYISKDGVERIILRDDEDLH